MTAGLQRARAEQAAGTMRRDTQVEGYRTATISGATDTAVQERLATGVGMLKVAHGLRGGSGTVQRVKGNR